MCSPEEVHGAGRARRGSPCWTGSADAPRRCLSSPGPTTLRRRETSRGEGTASPTRSLLPLPGRAAGCPTPGILMMRRDGEVRYAREGERGEGGGGAGDQTETAGDLRITRGGYTFLTGEPVRDLELRLYAAKSTSHSNLSSIQISARTDVWGREMCAFSMQISFHESVVSFSTQGPYTKGRITLHL